MERHAARGRCPRRRWQGWNGSGCETRSACGRAWAEDATPALVNRLFRQSQNRLAQPGMDQITVDPDEKLAAGVELCDPSRRGLEILLECGLQALPLRGVRGREADHQGGRID